MLPILGIDVAKRSFKAALRVNGKVKHKSCDNDASGFRELFKWLAHQKIERVHACLEATGTYGEALAASLADAGHDVSVANPAQVSSFGQSLLARGKTDKSDAERIALFCETMNPPLWIPPPPEVRELRLLVRRLDDLTVMRDAERNRLDVTPPTSTVVESIKTILSQLEAQILETRRLISEHFKNHPGLRASKDLLVTIPGIGEQTAAEILAEIPNLTEFRDARAVAAYVGITPKEWQSGTSIHRKPRISKIGNSRLRKALYMPAIVAKRWNPVISAFCDRLYGRGKCGKVVILAAMRKLVHIVYGVLKHRQPFDPALHGV